MKLMLSNKKNSILTVAVLLTQSFSSSRAFVCDLSPLAHTENKVFVINTCSQGIGHQFTKQLLRRSSPSTRVIGLHRSLTDSLSSLHSEYNDRLSLVSIDIESQASIDEAKLKIQSLTNHVDILINAAGILGDGKTTPGPERSATQIDRSWLEKTMQVCLPVCLYSSHVIMYPLFIRFKLIVRNNNVTIVI